MCVFIIKMLVIFVIMIICCEYISIYDIVGLFFLVVFYGDFIEDLLYNYFLFERFFNGMCLLKYI